MKRLGERTFQYLLTLTAPPDPPDYELTRETMLEWNASWRGLYQWLKREHPAREHPEYGPTAAHGPFNPSLQTYVFCNELGEKTGHLHQHIAAQLQWFCYICLREALPRFGYGDVCDFKRLKSSRGWSAHRAMRYLMKYVTKGSGRYRFPRYSRVVQRSRLPAEEKPEQLEKQEDWFFCRPYMRILLPEPIMYFRLPEMPYSGDWMDYG